MPRASLLSIHLNLLRNFPGFQGGFWYFLIYNPPRSIPLHFKKPTSALKKFLSLESSY